MAESVTEHSESADKRRGPQHKTFYGMTDEQLLAAETIYREGIFKDQVMLVSGGGTGIGKAIAVLFARLGAKVVICSRKEENLATTKELLSKIGAECDAHPMSIRDPEQVAGLMAAVWEKHGRLDLLVNNAGGQFPQEAVDYEPKGWQAVIDTNLSGSFYMMQAAARQWRDHNQHGNIVNILASFMRGMPHIAHTSAARAAVANLCYSLGVEWAPYGIRVNALAPGTIETTGLNVYPKQIKAKLRNHNPMRRLGTVMEVAETVAFLASPASGFMTGSIVVADGGQYMWRNAWALGEPEYFKLE